MKRLKKETYSCIGAAEATQMALRSSVEFEERQHMNVETVTHGFELFIVNFQENRIWIQFSQLTDLIN